MGYNFVDIKIVCLYEEYDPNFCPMSLDEAYLDITEYLLKHPGLKSSEVVNEMRSKIAQQTKLTASAGISLNTMLAKICSDLKKPNGQFELLNGEQARDFISNLPVRKIGGIGNVTEQLLSVLGVQNCEDIIKNRGLIYLLFSEHSAASFFRIALGIGSTNISEMNNNKRKSMSTETTFRDTSDLQKLREICDNLSSELSSDLQAENLTGRQVTVKIKTHKFDIKTKVSNLLQPTSDANLIKQTATKILNYFIDTSDDKPLTLRLLGIRISELLGIFLKNSVILHNSKQTNLSQNNLS